MLGTMIWVPPIILALISRCINLFFFYKSDDPYADLSIHDYGFNIYESFDSYMVSPTAKPIFETREQFLEYDTV